VEHGGLEHPVTEFVRRIVVGIEALLADERVRSESVVVECSSVVEFEE